MPYRNGVIPALKYTANIISSPGYGLVHGNGIKCVAAIIIEKKKEIDRNLDVHIELSNLRKEFKQATVALLLPMVYFVGLL